MIVNTNGIVLRSTRFSESSLIVKIFTMHSGVLSFMLKGARRPGRNSKAHLYEPGRMLSLVVLKRENKNLHTIKEAALHTAQGDISGNMPKTALLFFILELLNKCLKEEHAQEDIFHIAWHQLQLLYTADNSDLIHLPVLFMLRLAEPLGFAVPVEEKDFDYFDIQAGNFTNQLPAGAHLAAESVEYLQNVLRDEMLKAATGKRSVRRQTLYALIDYYRYHLSDFGKLNSPAILESVLDA